MAAEFLFSFEKHPNLKVVICKSFCVIWRSRYTSVRKVTEKSKSQSMLWWFSSCQRILRSHYFEWMGVAKIESQKCLLQTDDESEILIKNSFETRIPIKSSFGIGVLVSYGGNFAFHRLLRAQLWWHTAQTRVSLVQPGQKATIKFEVTKITSII